jgi:hypothetical protein
MNSRWLWVFILIVAGSIPVLTSLVVYWYNEAAPVSYSHRDVLTPSVPPGGTLLIKVSAELTKGCLATSYRSIIDSSGVQTDYEPVTRPAMTDFVVAVTVPLGAVPGPAKYRSRVDWNCNLVQRWYPRSVYLPELSFTIDPTPKQEQVPEKQGIFELPQLPKVPPH